MGARLSLSGRLPGRGLREPDPPPALPERTLEALPAHQLDRAHLRRDAPQDQGDRPAPRRAHLCRPRLRCARPATPWLARDDDDAASPQTPPRSPARAPRRAGRSRFRRHRHSSRIGSRRNLRLKLFTPRVGRHRRGAQAHGSDGEQQRILRRPVPLGIADSGACGSLLSVGTQPLASSEVALQRWDSRKQRKRELNGAKRARLASEDSGRRRRGFDRHSQSPGLQGCRPGKRPAPRVNGLFRLLHRALPRGRGTTGQEP